MAENSAIEWTDHTANFWWGCVKVSPGCQNCYAETLVKRFGHDNIWGPAKATGREYKKAIWKDLPKWNRQAEQEGKRRRVFVQSMSDFFEDHPQVTQWRWDAMDLMEKCTWLDFQVLTKRPENIPTMTPNQWWDDWPAHVWVGTSVEDQQRADERIPHLLNIPAKVRFLSVEPLLGPVDLWRFGDEEMGFATQWDHRGTYPFYQVLGWSGSQMIQPGIDWVIAGGESGPKTRPMHPDWARSIRDDCQAACVPYFFKQWGEYVPCEWTERQGGWWICQDGKRRKAVSLAEKYEEDLAVIKVGKKSAGRLLDGREWSEFPTAMERRL